VAEELRKGVEVYYRPSGRGRVFKVVEYIGNGLVRCEEKGLMYNLAMIDCELVTPRKLDSWITW
jgi:hypothetical protein